MKKVPEDHNPLNRGIYCGDPGALVSYLYNDGSPEELAAIAAHVQTCAACTTELASLGDTRELLSTWSPPQTELGLTLSASDALPVTAALHATAGPTAVVAADLPWWRQSTPVWMQAVAATMVFAAGMAIGTSSRGAAPAASPSAASAALPTSAEATAAKGETISRSELVALEERLRAELARLSPATPARSTQTAARTDDEALMKRIRSLMSESEERQRTELALRTAQVMRDMEIQRKVDMATVQQDLGKIQGITGAELKRQGELQNILINRVGLQGR
jgi:anti-sigma factor RsiW